MNKKTTLLSIEHPYEHVAWNALCAVLLFVIVTYVYFVSASVINVIARNEASARMNAIESRIATIEHAYFAETEGITQASASSLGLKPVQTTKYVYRPGNSAAAVTAERGSI